MRCSTQIYDRKQINNTESQHDPGTYFIVKGSQKIIISLQKFADNKILVFKKDEKTSMSYSAIVHSKYKLNMYKFQLFMNDKDKEIKVNNTYFESVPLCILLKALGLTSHRQILAYVVYDDNDQIMKSVINKNLIYLQNETYMKKGQNEEQIETKIQTQQDAIRYMMMKIKNLKKYQKIFMQCDTNKKQIIVKNILIKDILPHINQLDSNIQNEKVILLKKAYYVGYMANKLLQVALGGRNADSRDNYLNKRIELPGILLGQIFRSQYKKVINLCAQQFRAKLMGNQTIDTIQLLKTQTIYKGLIAALSTGDWGMSGNKRKKGVAQMKHNYTHWFGTSFIRKISASATLDSSNKIIKMRLGSGETFGYMCPVQHPDGAQCGILKHLGMTASVTSTMDNQMIIIQQIINEYVKTKQFNIYHILECKPKDILICAKIMLNGSFQYVTDQPHELCQELKK